jgi:two-component system chemotaxis sensor kinase CheA
VTRLSLDAYADLFRTEAHEHLEVMERALLALEAGGDSTGVDQLFRGLHTIKGMAATMGYAAVERLSHALESRCEPLRAGREPLRADTLSLLLEGVDQLRREVGAVQQGTARAHTDRLLARLAADGAGAEPAAPEPVSRPDPIRLAPAAAPTGSVREDRLVQVLLTPACPFKGGRALLVLRRLEALGDVLGVDPPQPRWMEDGFTGRFAVSVRSGASDEAVGDAVRGAGDVARVVVQPLLGRALGGETGARTVRLEARRLDTLLDLVSELVITRDRLLRQVDGGAPDPGVRRAAQEMGRLVSALQEEVLRTRMLPVSQVFDRFPRLVRDLARELGKAVRLRVEGQALEVDRSLLEALADPVVHLLRNAIDHGIEPPERRAREGKPAEGELRLVARRERAGIMVQVSDDGRGIDREAVLRKARDEGVVPPDTAHLDDVALLRVLARAGFSTAARVTTVSGRGVGVDAALAAVRAMGGSLALETVAGRGTTFTLRFPVTLAITRALLVRAGGATYAIPAAQVLEALELDPALLVAVDGHPGMLLRDEVVPVVPVAERFGAAAQATDGPPPVVLVEAGGRRVALQLEAVLEQRDIVVKPLDSVRGSPPWFSGATLLGDGTPALIVDVASLH